MSCSHFYGRSLIISFCVRGCGTIGTIAVRNIVAITRDRVVVIPDAGLLLSLALGRDDLCEEYANAVLGQVISLAMRGAAHAIEAHFGIRDRLAINVMSVIERRVHPSKLSAKSGQRHCCSDYVHVKRRVSRTQRAPKTGTSLRIFNHARCLSR